MGEKEESSRVRLGRVGHWAGIGVAVVFVFVGLGGGCSQDFRFRWSDDKLPHTLGMLISPFEWIFVFLAAAGLAYLAGRAARYVLSGE